MPFLWCPKSNLRPTDSPFDHIVIPFDPRHAKKLLLAECWWIVNQVDRNSWFGSQMAMGGWCAAVGALLLLLLYSSLYQRWLRDRSRERERELNILQPIYYLFTEYMLTFPQKVQFWNLLHLFVLSACFQDFSCWLSHP